MTAKGLSKNLAIVLAVIGILGASATSTFASPKGNSGKSEQQKKTSTTVATTKAICASTTAVGHKEPVVNPPAIPKTVPNRTFTFSTNCGDIVIEADGTHAPLTVLVMSTLAKAGYFNKTLCHRLTTNGLYVLQCGDPTATGSGGPMFTYDDENLPAAVQNNYPAGTVAMANSGLSQSGHGTNGSQFFLVYQDTTLGASYTRWGKIVKGLDILKAVAAQGVVGGGTDGTPKQTVAIEKVSVH